MAVDDIGDQLAELRELKRRVDRLESGTMLENSSITRGRMRFIGGTLRVDSGGRVEIVGTLAVEGSSSFIGPVTISGTLDISGDTTITGDLSIQGVTTVTGRFVVEGPWDFSGDGAISGDVDLTGDFEVLGGGRIKVGNVVITPGSGGRITVGTGSARVVIDGSTGRITAGKLRIDPTEGGGAVTFENGAQLYSDDNGQIELVSGDGGKVVHLDNNGVFVSNGSSSVMVDDEGVRVPIMPPLASGESAQYVVRTDEGYLRRSSGVGGGGTPEPGEDLGNFQWPFALSTVTSEYGPRTYPYTGFHEGIDFGRSPAVEGAPIIAAGDGIVAVSTFASGWGNHVRITHTLSGGQQVSTLYAHMNATPLVAVGANVKKGDVIGYVGNTGNSYGAHLHFETWMSTSYGSHVNPRDFMAAYGPE